MHEGKEDVGHNLGGTKVDPGIASAGLFNLPPTSFAMYGREMGIHPLLHRQLL
jgi:hypothetical protein